MSLTRQSREEAEFKAFLRAKRAYEKKLGDIEWDYEEFRPMLEAYQAGKLAFEVAQSPFAIEGGAKHTEDGA